VVPAAKQAAAAAAAAAGGGAGDPRFAKCGFAKLLGDNGLEYYIKKYEVVMGRKSKVCAAAVLVRSHTVVPREVHTLPLVARRT
jgi:hypothetical protein